MRGRFPLPDELGPGIFDVTYRKLMKVAYHHPGKSDPMFIFGSTIFASDKKYQFEDDKGEMRTLPRLNTASRANGEGDKMLKQPWLVKMARDAERELRLPPPLILGFLTGARG